MASTSAFAVGVSIGTSQANMSQDQMTVTLTCSKDFRGYLPPGSDERATGWDGSKPYNVASTYFYVQGHGIGRHSDDDLFVSLPSSHPGRAWGAKTWGDLYPWYRAQPRYEVDITLSIDPQPDPPILFAIGHGASGETQTAVVKRRFNTPIDEQIVTLRRYCGLDVTETVTFTVKAVITGKTKLE